jgi:sugar lactone lactonase YvrE
MTKKATRKQTLMVASMSIIAGCVASLAHAAAPAEIKIPGERIFPESMTSTADGTLIIGSVGAKTIFHVKPGAASAEPWIQPGTDGLASVFGVLADAKSNTLWACSSTFGPPGGPPSPPSTLYAFDLKTGASKGHYPFPTPGGFCNDIAIGPDGTAYASDTMNMEVVSLKKGGSALQVWAGNGAFGPKGGVLDGISVLGNRVLVNALATSKLFSVPIESTGKSGTVVEVQLDRPIDHPDGMRTFGKNSVLVVEGGSGGRLSRVDLTGDTGKVTTIKEGYPDGPVAVTVVGTTGYVLEGQIMAMRSAPDTPLKPFHATSVDVGKP